MLQCHAPSLPPGLTCPQVDREPDRPRAAGRACSARRWTHGVAQTARTSLSQEEPCDAKNGVQLSSFPISRRLGGISSYRTSTLPPLREREAGLMVATSPLSVTPVLKKAPFSHLRNLIITQSLEGCSAVLRPTVAPCFPDTRPIAERTRDRACAQLSPAASPELSRG